MSYLSLVLITALSLVNVFFSSALWLVVFGESWTCCIPSLKLRSIDLYWKISINLAGSGTVCNVCYSCRRQRIQFPPVSWFLSPHLALELPFILLDYVSILVNLFKLSRNLVWHSTCSFKFSFMFRKFPFNNFAYPSVLLFVFLFCFGFFVVVFFGGTPASLMFNFPSYQSSLFFLLCIFTNFLPSTLVFIKAFSMVLISCYFSSSFVFIFGIFCYF